MHALALFIAPSSNQGSSTIGGDLVGWKL